jgi:hypothetical protein
MGTYKTIGDAATSASTGDAAAANLRAAPVTAAAPAAAGNAVGTHWSGNGAYTSDLNRGNKEIALGGTCSVGTPIALAVVTWPSSNRPRDAYDYAYTSRDASTGKTTECRVKRTGNSVEIYLESKPATVEPPVKGSVEHENVPSA